MAKAGRKCSLQLPNTSSRLLFLWEWRWVCRQIDTCRMFPRIASQLLWGFIPLILLPSSLSDARFNIGKAKGDGTIHCDSRVYWLSVAGWHAAWLRNNSSQVLFIRVGAELKKNNILPSIPICLIFDQALELSDSL